MEELVELENENEEIGAATEEEANDSINAGALLTGVVGGIIAFIAIDGGRKLLTFAKEKRIERKQKKAAAKGEPVFVIDDDSDKPETKEEETEE